MVLLWGRKLVREGNTVTTAHTILYKLYKEAEMPKDIVEIGKKYANELTCFITIEQVDEFPDIPGLSLPINILPDEVYFLSNKTSF